MVDGQRESAFKSNVSLFLLPLGPDNHPVCKQFLFSPLSLMYIMQACHFQAQSIHKWDAILSFIF